MPTPDEERLALALGCTTDDLQVAIAASRDLRATTPAAALFPEPTLGEDHMAILYSLEGPEGLVVGVLEDATRAAHSAALHLRRPMRYAMCFRGAMKDGVLDGAWAGDAPGDAIVQHVLMVDPAAAILGAAAAQRLVTRPTEALSRATAAVEQHERGLTTCDVAGALGGLCAWVVDLTAEINKAFGDQCGAYTAALAAALDGGAASASAGQGFALSLVEAVLRRHTALLAVWDYVSPAAGVPQRLAAVVPPGLGAAEGFQQRLASLEAELHQSRAEAVCLSLLVRPLLTLKLERPVQRQSLAALQEDLLERIALALHLVVSTLPAPAVPLAQCAVTGPFLQQQLIPAITHDLVTAVDALLAPVALFEPRDAPADEPIDLTTGLPLCTGAAKLSQLHDAQRFLSRWIAAVGRATRVGRQESSLLQTEVINLGPLLAVGEDGLATSAAAYARDRCRDLLGFCSAIDRQGGLLTPQVACLYRTLSRAAAKFPLLRAHHHRNWALLVETFDRTLALRYEAVDTDVAFAEQAATVSPPAVPPAVPSRQSDLPSPPRDGKDEERAILQTRVALLTSELAECRVLVAAMRERALTAERALELLHTPPQPASAE